MVLTVGVERDYDIGSITQSPIDGRLERGTLTARDEVMDDGRSSAARDSHGLIRRTVVDDKAFESVALHVVDHASDGLLLIQRRDRHENEIAT
jgi:hypothetical protein